MSHADRPGPPTRRPTIVDVARHARVSPAAVSKVLRDAYGVSPQMRERVHASVAALGYRPMVSAQSMRSATRTLGVSSLNVHNPFITLLLDGVAREADRSRYSAFITLTDGGAEEQFEAARSMVDRQMDGLILITPTMSNEELQQLSALVPIVLLGRHGEDGSGSYDSVASDDTLGASLVVDHLVGQGHERIAFHTQSTRSGGLPEDFREAGYRQAMERHGLVPDVVVGEWTSEGGHRLAGELMARSRPPTAVHAGADVAALGALGWLWERGLRAPADLAVAACDDIPVASLAPISLTTTDQRAVEMGQLATRLLVERLEGRREQAQNVLVEPRLRVRASA
ncbi:LacI family DNA-binding transcriptional regulator [Auraticoccus monumenti]|uniref:Transcriptional regulator, LacI family n=1 Tax=Auraticoccus monumenti TaxID=675864 RepID=A0A1G7E402_9ACTN|nr:LacI family DNA-binding transcriptional regulator [Auraticoccus monumenti]SDE58391.1 transcriptional regulator, LacI family [Auraticoccus monumenti]